MTKNSRFLLILAVLFSIVFIFAAIEPYDRADWALENVLTVVLVVGLTLSYKKFPLTHASYLCIFTFLCLHEVGSHYTYAQVPYSQWTKNLFGSDLNSWFGFERNHYDRLVHFAYGLLMAVPIREIFIRIAKVKGFWSYFLPLDLTMSTSMLFELIEWLVAEIFAGDLGVAYLGTQGDIWDAHKDMALASLGALITILFIAYWNRKNQHNFSEEWDESLQVKK